MRGSHQGCGRASAIVQLQAGYMHADRFDITNKKLAKGAGSIQARKGRIPRVAALGVAGVHHYLHDRFALLTEGYRTALPRHQTLRATFDWSFSTLSPCNRLPFRRLAVCGGTFTLDAMCAVVCDESYAVADAINGITDLVRSRSSTLGQPGRQASIDFPSQRTPMRSRSRMLKASRR